MRDHAFGCGVTVRSVALAIVMLALTIEMKSEEEEAFEQARVVRGLATIALIVCLIMGW